MNETKILKKTKDPRAKENDDVSRLSCLRDFIMLRKTMNEILSKLEGKYRALIKRKGTHKEYEDFGNEPLESTERLEKQNVPKSQAQQGNGSASQGHIYYDQQLPAIEENYVDYNSQLNRRQQQPHPTTKGASDTSILGLLQVDPNGNKNGTMTIKQLNNMPKQETRTTPAGFATNRLWPGQPQ